jgi:hypothetical protein
MNPHQIRGKQQSSTYVARGNKKFEYLKVLDFKESNCSNWEKVCCQEGTIQLILSVPDALK